MLGAACYSPRSLGEFGVLGNLGAADPFEGVVSAVGNVNGVTTPTVENRDSSNVWMQIVGGAFDVAKTITPAIVDKYVAPKNQGVADLLNAIATGQPLRTATGAAATPPVAVTTPAPAASPFAFFGTPAGLLTIAAVVGVGAFALRGGGRRR